MHETIVAESLLAAISAEAEKQNARPVSAKISCGMLNAVNDEVLRFAFEAIAKGTACEGLELQVEHKSIRGRCKKCGEDFDLEVAQSVCSKCNSDDFEILPDAPLLLEELELETE